MPKTPETPSGWSKITPGKLSFNTKDVRAAPLTVVQKVFLLNVIERAQRDPGVVRRIMAIRKRINNGLRMTNPQAKEMLCRLGMKDFPHTDLDISRMRFPDLDLADARIGGNLNMSETVVERDVNMSDIDICGNVDQRRMKVNGDVNMNNIRIGGGMNQAGVQIGGGLNQNQAKIIGSLMQIGAWINGNVRQEKMQTGCDINQSATRIDGNLDQRGMETGSNLGRLARTTTARGDTQYISRRGCLSQTAMDIRGSVYQQDAVIRGSLDQSRMKIRGSLNQDRTEVWDDLRYEQLRVGNSTSRRKIKIGGSIGRYDPTIRKKKQRLERARWAGLRELPRRSRRRSSN